MIANELSATTTVSPLTRALSRWENEGGTTDERDWEVREGPVKEDNIPQTLVGQLS